MCVQAGAQVTPPSGTGSSASAATPPVASATRFPKSDAVLPTGTRENRWGPFEGRVVDAESGDGIAGAAVIVFWKKPVPELAGGHDEFYDARWAVSDADGRFVVPRRDPPFITWGLSGAFLSCVAPGYLPYEFTPYYNPRTTSARLREGQITVRMRRIPLTREQRRARLDDFAANNLSSIPNARFQMLTEQVNQQRAKMNLPPILLLYGELR